MTNSPWIWVALKLFLEYVWIWWVQIRRQGWRLCPMQSLRDMGSDHVPPCESSIIFWIQPKIQVKEGCEASGREFYGSALKAACIILDQCAVLWTQSHGHTQGNLGNAVCCVHKDALMDSLLACKGSVNGVKSGCSDSRASVNSTLMGGHPRLSSVYCAKDECRANSHFISRRHTCLLSLPLMTGLRVSKQQPWRITFAMESHGNPFYS